MFDFPLVSVIVPVYNVAQYLPQCINSLINQTYPHLEIILVNDGSTDNSGEVCDQYAKQDSRITVLHKINGGLSSARNAGMGVMTGELVAFVDSDDYVSVDLLMDCVPKFKKYPNLSIVKFAWLEFDGLGRQQLVYSVKTGEDRVLSHDEAFRLWLRAECGHSVCTALFRASALSSLQFLEGVYAEDLAFTLELFQNSDCTTLFIPTPLYYYRVNSGGITQSKTNLMWRDAFLHWANALKKLKEIDSPWVSQLAYGLFLQLKILENRHRYWRTSGDDLLELQNLLAPTYKLLESVDIDFSLSVSPMKDLLYWYCPRLFRLLRPSDWGVRSIRR